MVPAASLVVVTMASSSHAVMVTVTPLAIPNTAWLPGPPQVKTSMRVVPADS